MGGSKNAFVDPGYQKGRDFARFFLSSADFHIDTLKRLATLDSRANKDSLAADAARRLSLNELKPAVVLRALSSQSREWLTLKLGQTRNTKALLPPESLLFEFGQDGWHGPITDETDKPRWYIRTTDAPHYYEKGKEISQSHVRWLVFAEVTEGHIAYSWNNFTFSTLERPKISVQFPFWQYLPDYIQELERDLGGSSWKLPNLHRLVLSKLWDQYINDPLYRWQHLRIRAEFRGVALNAHSSGATDVDVRGLEALTAALAQSAAQSIGLVPSARQKHLLESGILKTLIREWGTNSYEFRLSKKSEDGGTDKPLFRGHCYFGLRTNLETEDSFQHIKCYKETRGHLGASNFLTSHLP